MRAQTMVQLTETLVGLLDERAAREGVSRSQVVRDAVEAYLREDAEAAALRAVVEGYRRQPVTDEELAAAAANARAVVDEEPW